MISLRLLATVVVKHKKGKKRKEKRRTHHSLMTWLGAWFFVVSVHSLALTHARTTLLFCFGRQMSKRRLTAEAGEQVSGPFDEVSDG